MAVVNDPVYLSLDDIIQLNKERNKRSGSIRSFGSNRSNRSNYSNRSYGGMSNRSFGNISNYSNRSQNSRGRRGCQNNNNHRGGRILRNQGSLETRRGFGRVNNYQNANYRYLNRSRHNSLQKGRNSYDPLHNFNLQTFARNRVKNALKLLNKSSQQRHQGPFHPYPTTNRMARRAVERTFAESEDIVPSGISINVHNEFASRRGRRRRPAQGSGLTIQRLAQCNQTSVSPLNRLPRLMSSNNSRVISLNKNNWGPKLDPKVQEQIAEEMENSTTVCPILSEDELNECIVIVSTTVLTLHERFGSYL